MKTNPRKKFVKKRKSPLHHRQQSSTKSQPFRQNKVSHRRPYQPARSLDAAARPLENEKDEALVSSVVFARDMLVNTSALAGLPIGTACQRWVESQVDYLAPLTIEGYRMYAKTMIPNTFKTICEEKGVPYSRLLLDHMDGNWLRAYQQQRLREGVREVINKEVCVIRQTYYEAFKKHLADYKRIPKPKNYESPGRKLGDEERKLWKQICKENSDDPATDIAALISLITVCSGAGPGEVRSLKLKDCHIGERNAIGLEVTPYIMVPPLGAKRPRRERKVRLFDEAPWALQKLIDRAKKKCGCTSPNHFLLPYQRRNHTYDVNKPGGRNLHNGMRQLLIKAETQFRMYDLRHDAISVALSDKRVPLAAAIKHFGWISPKMIDTYYHGDDVVMDTVGKAINQIPDAPAEPMPPKKPAAKVRTSVQLMNSCPECLGEIPQGARRCKHCGQPVAACG